MTTNKARKMTFRQRLRAQSEERLEKMASVIRLQAIESVKAVSQINPFDVMKLACGTQTKSLRYRLVTELANEAEAELEALYNKQIELPMNGENDDES